MARNRLEIDCSMASWISSSRKAPTTLATTVPACSPTLAALAGWASQEPSRAEMGVARSFSPTTSAVRKLVSTKVPSPRPMSSLRFGMMAVCGIGRPSGRLNSAVTANQSARAPTIEASAKAAT